jgi:hypothetical protein
VRERESEKKKETRLTSTTTDMLIEQISTSLLT